jgi:hypothetical protein
MSQYFKDAVERPARLGKPILMDVPAMCKRNGLFAVQLETEKGSDLIKGTAETRGGGGRLPGSARVPHAHHS